MSQWCTLDPRVSSNADPHPLYFWPTIHWLDVGFQHTSRDYSKSVWSLLHKSFLHTGPGGSCCQDGMPHLIAITPTYWRSLVGLWSDEDPEVEARQWNPGTCEDISGGRGVQEPIGESQGVCSLGIAEGRASLLRKPCPCFMHAWNAWSKLPSGFFFPIWDSCSRIYFRKQMAFYVPSSSSQLPRHTLGLRQTQPSVHLWGQRTHQ